jgi:plasmid stabilization system protein ParE
MRYVFHPEALSEYAEAVQYYTEQRVEVAQAFINAIEDTVYRIRESPNRYIEIDHEVRKCMVRRFPYKLLYTVEQDFILILAIMHCSRKPGYWKNRQ